MQALLGLRADAGDSAHGKGSKEVRFGAGRDQDQPVRLSRAARDLRYELGGGRAHRCRQSDLGVDLKLDATRDLLGIGGAMTRARGDIEVGLVQADAFDQLWGGEPAEDLVDLAAGLAVFGSFGADHRELRAKLHRLVERHRRANAERARFVGRTHDNRAARAPRNRYGNPAQLRIISLMHRCVEGVDVDMEDGSRPVVGAGHGGQSGTTTCALSRVRALPVLP